jgi:pyruvate/2-oxoglutarate/acetoin dehydrogenase E1 component
MPATPADTRGLIKSALQGEDPVIFLMHKMLTGVRGEVNADDEPVPIGSARVARPGRDLTIVAYSVMVPRALEAAGMLSKDGIEAEVIDLRTVFPIDFDLVATSVKKTGKVIVTGEAPRHGGVIGEIAATIQETMFDHLDGPVLRVGGGHAPIPFSPPLFDCLIPHAADIDRAARSMLVRSGV